MKFCHIADTHLGFSAYRKIEPKSGLNQREIDICNSFKEAIEAIIELKPDFVIHSGDLFDSPRPANRIVSFAIKNLLRLTKITKVIIISGNHSTPKTANYGSIFEILDIFPELKVVYKGSYQPIRIGEVLIHAVPQCLDDRQFHKELKKLKLAKDCFNILAVHAGITGFKEFSMEEFGETHLPQEYLKMDFDYIALGHFHRMTKVTDKAFYSGSTERMSFNESQEYKGFILYDLKKGESKFQKLKTRPMLNLSFNCKNIKAEDISKRLKEFLVEHPLKESILKLKLIDIDKSIYRNLDWDDFRDIKNKCLQFSLDPRPLSNNEEIPPEEEIGNINREFIKFCKKNDLESLKEVGLKYLKETEVV